MWARDFLIIDSILYHGEHIRVFRCESPNQLIPMNSNAVFIQLQGIDRYGVLQKITSIKCFRGSIIDKLLQINIVNMGTLNDRELRALNILLAQEYPKIIFDDKLQNFKSSP
jgi:hypothetical protein